MARTGDYANDLAPMRAGLLGVPCWVSGRRFRNIATACPLSTSVARSIQHDRASKVFQSCPVQHRDLPTGVADDPELLQLAGGFGHADSRP
jgi:hypothetical protein